MSGRFPHTLKITRSGEVDYTTAPYTENPDSDVWSGDCDCQVGGTYEKQFVAESTHIIYAEFITAEIKYGDKVHVIKHEGWTPIEGEVLQFDSREIFEEDGKVFGTTIWVRETRN